MSTKTADGSGIDGYRQPKYETWYLISNNEDENTAIFAGEGRSANRARAKGLDKYLYLNGKKLAKIDDMGRAATAIEYSRDHPDQIDLKEAVEAKGDTSLDDVEEGFEIYKTAEDDEGLYFHTSPPQGYEHESADPAEYTVEPESEPEPEPEPEPESDGDGTPVDMVSEQQQEQLATSEYPTPVRLPSGASDDDLKFGQTYDAEVNNTSESYGIFVSLPDTNTPNQVTGLVYNDDPRHDDEAKLDKLKSPTERADGKGDSLVVAPSYRRVDDGKWGFVIVDSLDTHAHVEFDNDVPREPRYVKRDGEEVDPGIGRRALGITEDETDEAEPEAAGSGMSASPYRLQQSAPKATVGDVAEVDEPEDEDMHAEASNDTEADAETGEPPEGSLKDAYTKHPPSHDDGEYADIGEDVDEDAYPKANKQTVADVEPSLENHYADSDELNEARDELFFCLRQVHGDLDAADFIRLKLAEMDEEQTREFIRIAASSELPDDLFRKLTRELA